MFPNFVSNKTITKLWNENWPFFSCDGEMTETENCTPLECTEGECVGDHCEPDSGNEGNISRKYYTKIYNLCNIK